MAQNVEGQMNMFGEVYTSPTKLAKCKNAYSIYAIPRRYDSGHIEVIVYAYTEKQARFLFYKNHAEYLITGIYQCS